MGLFKRKPKGVVYIMECGPDTYKIGKTTDGRLEQRRRSIQTGNPYPVKIVYARTFKNPEYARKIEQSVHKSIVTFGGVKKLQGEWFYIKPRKLRKIIRMLKRS